MTLPNSVSLNLIGGCTGVTGFVCSKLGTDFASIGSSCLIVSSFTAVFTGVRGLGVEGKSLGVVLALAFSATRANKIQYNTIKMYYLVYYKHNAF